MFLDSNTKVEGENIFKSQYSDKVYWSDAVKSLLHFFLLFISKDINLSWRKSRICSEDVIKPGVDAVVQGVLKESNHQLQIFPSIVMLARESHIMNCRNYVDKSIKALVGFGILWAATYIYKRAKAGQFKIFSKEWPVEIAEVAEKNECIICLNNQRDTILYPCMHMAVCSRCNSLDKCPICRNGIAKTEKIIFIN